MFSYQNIVKANLPRRPHTWEIPGIFEYATEGSMVMTDDNSIQTNSPASWKKKIIYRIRGLLYEEGL